MEVGVQFCATYVPLSPISFLERAADLYGDKVSVVYGSLRFTWRETYQRCLKLSSALVQLQISHGDIVAAFAPNIPPLYELHFAVPMARAVLSPLNIKLDAATLALILEQLEAKVIFVDYQFIEVVFKALDIVSKIVKPPLLVVIPECDPTTYYSMATTMPKSSTDFQYDDLLAMGRADFGVLRPKNECDPISVNFTSGSTGNPKGVVYSHRATYLNTLAAIFRYDLGKIPVFLWTVDMFRCNGWCLIWAMAARGGTNICLRDFTAKTIFDSVLAHRVTHLCGAPTILNIIADGSASDLRPLPCKVNIIVAGVLPMPSVLIKIEDLGFVVSFGYGMTEALGPVIVRPWRPESENYEHKKIKQLDDNLIIGVDVNDPSTMKSVPFDGKTIGEVMFRGNTLMSGYHKNPKATQDAFKDGWFRTGDLAIRHPDGNIQMKDRAEDIIISAGGETISTLEVETVLLTHPKILEAAVVGKSDDQLKVRPCAFVRLKQGFGASAQEIIEFCDDRLLSFMVPQTIIFGDLPVNFSGKVHKFILREKANAMGSLAK